MNYFLRMYAKTTNKAKMMMTIICMWQSVNLFYSEDATISKCLYHLI